MIRALVAQLDRASGYGPEGLGFESLQAYHFSFLKTCNFPQYSTIYNMYPKGIQDYGERQKG